MDETLDKSRSLLVCVLLIVATLAVYWPVRSHDFVNYDDDHYITENRHVRAGLTKEGIIGAFTTPPMPAIGPYMSKGNWMRLLAIIPGR